MLKFVPSQGELSRLYFELAHHGARCVGKRQRWSYGIKGREELIALAAEMSRYDPRLLDILVEYFIEHYQKINPLKLRHQYDKMGSCQTIGVICEFLKSSTSHPEQIYFADYLQKGILPARTQYYFHHLYQVGGVLASKTLYQSLWEYKKWGFLALHKPTIDPRLRTTVGHLDKHSRLNILEDLLKKRLSIKISDYLKALDSNISRQQALIDLKTCSFAIQKGRGRGALWDYRVVF